MLELEVSDVACYRLLARREILLCRGQLTPLHFQRCLINRDLLPLIGFVEPCDECAGIHPLALVERVTAFFFAKSPCSFSPMMELGLFSLPSAVYARARGLGSP